jgi:hypothetical protein
MYIELITLVNTAHVDPCPYESISLRLDIALENVGVTGHAVCMGFADIVESDFLFTPSMRQSDVVGYLRNERVEFESSGIEQPHDA